MNASSNCQVLIIGSGISGLSAAWHLKKLGLTDYKIITHAPSKNEERNASAGMVCGGYLDNFTRFENTFGAAKAKAYWQFSMSAFFALEKFCKLKKIDFFKNHRLRVFTTEHELTEGKIAVKLLHGQNFNAKLIPHFPKKFSLPKNDEANILGVQDEGVLAAYCQSEKLLRKLHQESKTKIVDANVIKLTIADSGVEVLCSNKKKIGSEIVILATHLSTAKLLPQLAEAYVSTHDQWLEAKLSSKEKINLPQGMVSGFTHGHEWLVCVNSRTVRMGGARFLLKDAGTGLDKATYSAKIESYLMGRIKKIFALSSDPNISVKSLGLDCRPCDELPIIGPLFGEDRVLLAGGYSGQALSLGFFAGKCLADLIVSGSSANLPRDFWPTRLRSLND